MKRTLFLICCAIMIATACRKSDIASGIPDCIYKEISSNKNNSDWAIGSVKEYRFQGKLVYSFEPDSRIADGASGIHDADCNVLCTVGGFGGPDVNLCNGINFFQNAQYIRTIWERK